MKFFLIFFFFFSPVLKADGSIRWETDYYPNFGRVMITYLGQDRVLLEEDKNNCSLDNFGNPSACTLMAPIINVDTINLMLQSDQFELYQFSNAKHLRLSKGNGIPKILVMDRETGGVILALRLNRNWIEIPNYLRAKGR